MKHTICHISLNTNQNDILLNKKMIQKPDIFYYFVDLVSTFCFHVTFPLAGYCERY